MRPTTLEVGPGAMVRIDDQVFCVTRFLTTDSVIVRNIETDVERSIKLGEISESLAKEADGARIDLSSVTKEDWDSAIERYKTLRFLVREPIPTSSPCISGSCSWLAQRDGTGMM